MLAISKCILYNIFMENANIVLVEDNNIAREAVRKSLAATSHSINCEATTVDEALAAVNDIACGKLACDVVILDGDLDFHSSHRHPHAGYAAKEVVNRIHALSLSLKVIGFSANSLAELGISVDIDLPEKNLDGLETAIAAF
jgi:CheY-like chemotaxis protein